MTAFSMSHYESCRARFTVRFIHGFCVSATFYFRTANPIFCGINLQFYESVRHSSISNHIKINMHFSIARKKNYCVFPCSQWYHFVTLYHVRKKQVYEFDRLWNKQYATDIRP